MIFYIYLFLTLVSAAAPMVGRREIQTPPIPPYPLPPLGEIAVVDWDVIGGGMGG